MKKITMEKKIEQDNYHLVKIIGGDGGSIASQSVEANLLFSILEKLEEIRCGIIDVEDAVNPR